MEMSKNTEELGKKMSNIQCKRLLNILETAEYLGLSPRTIYNGIAPKTKTPFPIKPKRWGRKVLFDINDLDQYIDSLGLNQAHYIKHIDFK